MLEWYEAYADYQKTAHDLELLVAEVLERVIGRTDVSHSGEGRIDFAPPWRRMTLREAIRDRTDIDIAEHPSREQLAVAMGGEADAAEGWGKLVDGLLSREVEPHLIEPTILFDYPVELSPFAKAHRSEPGLVERWEAFAGGVEIANSFSELATIPTSSAAASSSRLRSFAVATRRPSPTMRASSRRSSRECRRPAALGSGSTGW